MTARNDSCGQCRWFNGPVNQGSCRRHAPPWPGVMAWECCGDFQRDEQPPHLCPVCGREADTMRRDGGVADVYVHSKTEECRNYFFGGPTA